MPPTKIAAGKNWSLFHGSCISFLEALPEGTIDVIFADPPYNLSNDGMTCSGGRWKSVNKGTWDKSRGVEEDFSFHRTWIQSCRRALKPNGTIWISGTYHSIYSCAFALQQDHWTVLNDICWYKRNAPPNLSCRYFTASHETLIWAKKSKKARHTFNYAEIKADDGSEDTLKKPNKQARSVWSFAPPSLYEKRFGKHPTQKPEALLERIVLASTQPGEVVLDPFCGSGTTGVAALRMGRKFIGIDLDSNFLGNIALKRLADEEKNYGKP